MTATSPPAQAAPGAAPSQLYAGRLGQASWALYEFARSPYVSLVFVYVFAPYFATTVVGDPVQGQAYWSLANTLAGASVAVLAPLLGAMGDRMGRRKPWILAFTLVMSPACLALWFAMPGAQGGLPLAAVMALIVLLVATFELGVVFHNAMLPSIAPPARMGGLSGLGLAVGNIGTFSALAVMLFLVALPASGAVDWPFLPQEPLFGLDPARHEHDRISGPIAGVWLLLFVLPLMLWTPDRPATGVSAGRAVREGLAQLWLTVRRVREVANVGRFLLARMLYNDGAIALIAYSGIYASGVFGWDLAAMLVFALALAFFCILGGFLGGLLDDTIGSKRAIQTTVGAAMLGLVAALSITPDEIFFLPYDAAAAGPVWAFPYFRTLPELLFLAAYMILAMVLTATFANTRTMMARIAPLRQMSQFFGLLALSGTVTAFAGHALVAAFTAAFQSQRAGLASVLILLGAGLVVMRWVREERAPDLL